MAAALHECNVTAMFGQHVLRGFEALLPNCLCCRAAVLGGLWRALAPTEKCGASP